MTTDNQTPGFQQLDELFGKLSEVDPRSLAQTERLGRDHDFSHIVSLAEHIVFLVRSVHESPHRFAIPANYVQRASDYARQASMQFDAILAFKRAGHPDPDAHAEKIRSRLVGAYEGLYGLFSSFSLQMVWKEDAQILQRNAKKMRQEAEGVIESTRQARSELEKRVQENVDDMQRKLLQVQESTAKLGVAAHAKHFSEAAEQHESAATAWFWGVVVCWVPIAALIGWNIYHFPTNIEQALPRAVMVAFLWSVAAWCSKNRRAEKHLYNVNKHKANSLSSFETFVAASDDVETKNAVLLSATEHVFRHQPSGYDSTKGKAADVMPPSKMIEVFRSRDMA